MYDPDGKHVGRSRIELTTGGRVILKSWTGDSGLVGSSMNFHDSEDGRWHQVWVDAHGGVLRFDGGYAEGAPRYAGESALPDGGRQQERLTFTPLAGGRVHRLWEQSQDSGRRWTVAFDGTYVPRRDVRPSNRRRINGTRSPLHARSAVRAQAVIATPRLVPRMVS